MTKICSVCKIEKDTSCFNKNVHSKDGLSSWCRDCQRVYYHAYQEKNHEKHKAHSRKYYQTHKEEYKVYRQSNRDKRIAYLRAYREIHREYLNASRRLKRQRTKAKAAWDATKIDPQQLKTTDANNNNQLSLINA